MRRRWGGGRAAFVGLAAALAFAANPNFSFADERFDGRLTDPALLRIDYLPPPADVAPYVTTFFLMRCDER
jgi:hypothetical protein